MVVVTGNPEVFLKRRRQSDKKSSANCSVCTDYLYPCQCTTGHWKMNKKLFGSHMSKQKHCEQGGLWKEVLKLFPHQGDVGRMVSLI